MQDVGRRRWWILAATVMATLAIGLDGTVLSVALPTLAADLHATTSQLQWFLASYTLVLAAAVLPGGLLGDRFGRRHVPGPSDRTHSRRVAAVQLLVGLGVPDQPAGRAARRGRGGAARAGVAGRAAPRA
jgi:MFS family permease